MHIMPGFMQHQELNPATHTGQASSLPTETQALLPVSGGEALPPSMNNRQKDGSAVENIYDLAEDLDVRFATSLSGAHYYSELHLVGGV